MGVHVASAAENLRSLEGVRVQGGRIAAGRLWRSDNITASPDEEIVRLRDLGLSTVIDLRAPDELEITGREVLDRHGIRHVHRPMTRKTADPTTLATTFDTIRSYQDVGKWYLRLARARSAVLAQSLQDITETEGGVLFCCTAGKDRTGVLAAVLLLLLGSENEAIVDDYALTGPAVSRIHRRQSLATGRPTPSERYPDHPMLHAHPTAMRTFLRGIRESGGVEALLSTTTDEGGPGGSPSSGVLHGGAPSEHLPGRTGPVTPPNQAELTDRLRRRLVQLA